QHNFFGLGIAAIINIRKIVNIPGDTCHHLITPGVAHLDDLPDAVTQTNTLGLHHLTSHTTQHAHHRSQIQHHRLPHLSAYHIDAGVGHHHVTIEPLHRSAQPHIACTKLYCCADP